MNTMRLKCTIELIVNELMNKSNFDSSDEYPSRKIIHLCNLFYICRPIALTSFQLFPVISKPN